MRKWKLRLENRNTKVGLKLWQDPDDQNTATALTDPQSPLATYSGLTGSAENPADLEPSLNAQSSTHAHAAQIKMTQPLGRTLPPSWTHASVKCQVRHQQPYMEKNGKAQVSSITASLADTPLRGWNAPVDDTAPKHGIMIKIRHMRLEFGICPSQKEQWHLHRQNYNLYLIWDTPNQQL